MPSLTAIYGPPGEHRVDDQLERLSQATSAARQRDVGYLEVRRQPQAAMFRDLAGLEEQSFAVVLICDSEEIARWNGVVEPDDIWRAFEPADLTGSLLVPAVGSGTIRFPRSNRPSHAEPGVRVA